ncbi:ELM1/GtrOC1 family putative glycosyltransferase [Marinobacter koreensis]|uniref:ELM1/GtrOC1 family putative glycosyltransferase n=1 Tax=Marinobacter koreensis TaxID=335974 RepID=A0ABW0RMV3_9GAMM|nr:ELM1/GtrOC1 family putative glycosyltransferase [Marinobacter koreensis]MCK7549777.1 mitochondrial fission ELM1 family protein [Marinobacter koreensis]
MRRLHVLLLSDGLDGHVNQARGLVAWLSERYAIECVEVDVRLRFRAIARLSFPSLLRNVRWASGLIVGLYKSFKAPLPRSQLIVSAGGNTSFLNVALGRKWRVPNVFLGSKRRLRSDDFAAHLTLEPTGEPNNIVMMLAPTLVNPEDLRQKGRDLRLALNLSADEKLNMLAVGGDGAGYQYDSKAVQQLAQLLIWEHERTGKRWLLTTSRRTGADLEKQLRQSIPPTILADSVWWSENPRKAMSAYLGAADQVFITADSMSMIAEAIASEKPSVVLVPERACPTERYQEALDKFFNAKLAVKSDLIDPRPCSISPVHLRDIKDHFLCELEQLLPVLADYRVSGT